MGMPKMGCKERWLHTDKITKPEVTGAWHLNELITVLRLAYRLVCKLDTIHVDSQEISARMNPTQFFLKQSWEQK